MAINLNDNIKISANKPLDFKFGPFESVTQANSLIPGSQRHHGLIFGVYTTPLSLAQSDIEYYYYWEDLSDTSVKRLLLDQNFLDAINTQTNASANNPFATIEDISILTGGNNQVIFGGVPQWSGTGLTFNTPYTGYIISGVYYEDGPGTLTLTTANPIDPRRDRFYLNSSGWGFLTGTPAAVPVAPQVDSITQIDRGDVLIAAGATVPTVTNINVYLENTEWTTSSSGTGTFNPNSTVNPLPPSAKCFRVTGAGSGSYMQFENVSDVNLDTIDVIGVFVELDAILTGNQRLFLYLLDSLNQNIAKPIALPIDKSSTSWQFTSIAKNDLKITATNLRKFRIGTSGLDTSGGFSFAIDNFILETGVGQPEGPQNIILGNEVSGTGTIGTEVLVSLTEKALSNRLETTEFLADDLLLVRKNSDGLLYKIKKSNLGISGGGGISGLTTNKLPKATSATTIGDSGITEESATSYLYGTRIAAASSAPLKVSFGGTFGNNTPGNSGNLKWVLFDNGVANDLFGIGMSSGLMEFRSGANSEIGFFPNNGGDGIRMSYDTSNARLKINHPTNAGIRLLNGNVNKWVIASYGTNFDFAIYNEALNRNSIFVRGNTNRTVITETGAIPADSGYALYVVGSSLGLVVSGNSWISGDFKISRNGGAQANPTVMHMGDSYGTSTPGSANNLKWKLYTTADSTPNLDDYGIGMSSGLMEFRAGANASMAFFPNNGVELMRLISGGFVTIGVNAAPANTRMTVRGLGTTTQTTALWEDSAGTDNVQFLDNGQVRFLRIPTASAGLASGTIWNDGGILKTA